MRIPTRINIHVVLGAAADLVDDEGGRYQDERKNEQCGYRPAAYLVDRTTKLRNETTTQNRTHSATATPSVIPLRRSRTTNTQPYLTPRRRRA